MLLHFGWYGGHNGRRYQTSDSGGGRAAGANRPRHARGAVRGRVVGLTGARFGTLGGVHRGGLRIRRSGMMNANA